MKKRKKRKQKIQVSPKGCFLLQMLIPIYYCKCKGLQGGTVPLVDLFFAFFQDFEKENSCFGEGIFLSL